MNTYTTTLLGATRLKSSVNGNPRFALHTDAGDFVTQSDGACSYEVDNYARKAPVMVELKTTRAGRVWSIEAVKA